MNPTAPRTRWCLILPWALHHAGGVNVVVKALAQQLNGLSDTRAEIWIDAALTPEEMQRSALAGIAVRQQRLRGWDACEDGLRSALGMLARLPGTWSALRRGGHTVLNLHYPTGNLTPLILLRLFGLLRSQVIASLHGADIRRFSQVPTWRKRLCEWLLNRCDAVVVVSEAFRQECLQILPGLRNTRVIHNGVDAALPANPSSSPALPRPCFLAVATYEHKKGLDTLVAAFSQIATELPEWHLVICGRRTPYADTLATQVAQLQLQGRVHQCYDQPHENMAGIYAQASIFVHGARAEPFGLVILEAVRQGLPVIATRVGGIPEIITSDSEGILVPPDDPDAMAQQMRSLAQDAAHRQRLATQARTRLLQRFSWQRCAASYQDIALPG